MTVRVWEVVGKFLGFVLVYAESNRTADWGLNRRETTGARAAAIFFLGLPPLLRRLWPLLMAEYVFILIVITPFDFSDLPYPKICKQFAGCLFQKNIYTY